ncbi:MAG TPA: prepilin-type N-terminal cleavage/methylation domain-containing protein [bacterium]|nr:prepilin-type N-terminal cleavage/methylation domain-containing protein [bacterium]
MKISQRKSAFTLIELLIVIFIIAIISTLAYVSLGVVKSNGRDTKRLADINSLKQALELYRDHEGNYPVNLTSQTDTLTGKDGRIYLKPIPRDPLTKELYSYQRIATSDYRLIFSLERDNNGYKAGENIIDSVESTEKSN